MMAELRTAIRSLDVGPEPPPLSLEEWSGASCAVVAGSVIVFDDSVTGQHHRDTLESVLLAQLAASAKADRHKDPSNWYKAHQKVLETIGWVVDTSSAMRRYFPPGTRFSMANVVTDLFERKLGPEDLYLIKHALSTFRRDTTGPAQVVFECPSHSGGIGNFQCGLVTETGDTLNLQLGRFDFNCPTHVTRLALEEFPRDASFRAGFISLTLNEEAYSAVRTAVHSKVESRFQGSVAQLALDSN